MVKNPLFWALYKVIISFPFQKHSYPGGFDLFKHIWEILKSPGELPKRYFRGWKPMAREPYVADKSLIEKNSTLKS